MHPMQRLSHGCTIAVPNYAGLLQRMVPVVAQIHEDFPFGGETSPSFVGHAVRTTLQRIQYCTDTQGVASTQPRIECESERKCTQSAMAEPAPILEVSQTSQSHPMVVDGPTEGRAHPT